MNLSYFLTVEITLILFGLARLLARFWLDASCMWSFMSSYHVGQGCNRLDLSTVLHANNNAMEEVTLEKTNVSIKKVLARNSIHESNAKDAANSQSFHEHKEG
ncbi:DNA-directed RNA polymerase II subunit 2 [Striga asiatica]|uniref:DNA-directed RNA polymerase II subunit 2 n=1 Tax=Striga asiatica TaxID=4170 RepID=A0A5A7PGP8_STRAF|nr:DNA-directed RNA polymerase II subunit 2 [Striga asiatica]